MSETFVHACIKCSQQYSSNEVDPYLCGPCNEQRKIIAKEVDAKLATRVSKRKVKSDFQKYDEICKARGSRFVNARDLM